MLNLDLRENQIVRIQDEPFIVRKIGFESVEVSFLNKRGTITKYNPFNLGALTVILKYCDGELCNLGFQAPKQVSIDREKLWVAKRGKLMTIKGY